jgi:signal recognition particle GTPase
MISLFRKPEKAETAEPSLLERLKASVAKTKTALAQTVDNIFLGEKQIDPAALKHLEAALLPAELG